MQEDFCITADFLYTKNKTPEKFGSFSWWRDLNPRPIDYESIALPLRHTSKCGNMDIILQKVGFVNTDVKNI